MNNNSINGNIVDNKLNSIYKSSMLMVLMPIVFVLIDVMCWIMASLLEVPTNRGGIYTAFALAAIIIAFLIPLPSIVLALIGMVRVNVSKSQMARFVAGQDGFIIKNYNKQNTAIIIIGLLDILFSVVTVIVLILAIMGGMSV